MWIDISLSGILCIIAYQDLRFRAIHWITLPSLFALLLFRAIINIPFTELAVEIMQNLLFVGLQIGILFIYVLFHFRQPNKFFVKFLGFGDVLFLIVITVGFITSNFILFLTSGYMIAVLSYSFIRIWNKKQITIPLAGILAIFLVCFLFVDNTLDTSLFYSPIIPIVR
ncbi:MAG: hypothetical protein IH946_08950 [Bacteroidetes bacterium]|nr:hypothetical protein [Bacteroidota bacterium]